MRSLLKRLAKAACGLCLFAFGVYLTIQASIGLSPWDVFATGLADKLRLTFGQISILISAVIITIDILLGEKIGMGTVLDALLVGSAFDLYDRLNLVMPATNTLAGIAMMLLGLLIMAIGQWLYMTVGLGCGPRDSLLVAVGKRMPRVPIGVVQFLILLFALGFGYLLGGPVGIGTVIGFFGMGSIMQLVFSIVRFEPRTILHENVFTTLKSLPLFGGTKFTK